MRPLVSYWSDAWRRFRRNPLAMVALAVLVVFALLVIFAPLTSGHDAYAMDATVVNQEPSSAFWFGTDALGRDLWTRVWVGARVSLIVAIACAFVQIVVGSLCGAAMAYFGGTVDEVLMRVIELMSSVPSLLISLIIMMVAGNNMGALLLAMCITSWMDTARQVRGLVKGLRESDYVAAARCLGASPLKIIVRHLIPNTLSILLLDLFMSIPSYIFSEASLSFLGMGLKAPEISLGTLISDGQSLLQIYPFQLFYPALVLCLIVLAFNLFGDGLRDALDPRMRK
ncbi:ABC transporter permease [Olsenella profusa]|uniref:ABC transporter permease n=2 Tax=Olsenella profusa TaxID=138595 RepID=A0ABS2F1T7_9ACTN|nr:ABC transporter permease [Olsenella profusa]